MKLIYETAENSQLELLTEGTGENRKLYLEGIMASCERKNKNGRVYRKATMVPIVEDYLNNKVNKGVAFGTLGHENSPEIDLAKVSHRVVKLDWRKNDLVGKALVLNEGMGRILSGIVKGGGAISFSTRGVGTLQKDRDGNQIVQEDYKLCSIDAVL